MRTWPGGLTVTARGVGKSRVLTAKAPLAGRRVNVIHGALSAWRLRVFHAGNARTNYRAGRKPAFTWRMT